MLRVHVPRRRLHDEHVGATDVLVDLERDLAYPETVEGGLAPARHTAFSIFPGRAGDGHFPEHLQSRSPSPSVEALTHHHCFRAAPWNAPRADRLAGAEGFEPSNAGFKVPCLTAWRRPVSAKDAPALPDAGVWAPPGPPATSSATSATGEGLPGSLPRVRKPIASTRALRGETSRTRRQERRGSGSAGWDSRPLPHSVFGLYSARRRAASATPACRQASPPRCPAGGTRRKQAEARGPASRHGGQRRPRLAQPLDDMADFGMTRRHRPFKVVPEARHRAFARSSASTSSVRHSAFNVSSYQL